MDLYEIRSKKSILNLKNFLVNKKIYINNIRRLLMENLRFDKYKKRIFSPL